MTADTLPAVQSGKRMVRSRLLIMTVHGPRSEVWSLHAMVALEHGILEPGGCTAFGSHSNSNTLIHPARARCCGPAAAGRVRAAVDGLGRRGVNDTCFCFVCSTAFTAETVPLPCVPLPSRLRQCLCLVCSTAFAAKTVPLPCVFHCLRG